MIIIGVTGSIASGKSALCSCFSDCGIPVFSADGVVSALYKDRSFATSVLPFCADMVNAESGLLDRLIVREMAIKNNHAFLYLTRRLHQRVFREAVRFICANRQYACVVLEVPLLLESRMSGLCDVILSVRARDSLRLERYIARTGANYNGRLYDKLSRIHYPADRKAAMSDVVIYNNTSKMFLVRQLFMVLHQYGVR